jgi:hypothetical protein
MGRCNVLAEQAHSLAQKLAQTTISGVESQATARASSFTTSRPQPTSSAVYEHVPFQLAVQSSTIPLFSSRSDVETPPPAVAVLFSPSLDSPCFPRTPFATPSASSSSTSRPQSTSSTVQEQDSFQLAAQSSTIPSFSPRSDAETPPPAVAVPPSPSPDSPYSPRTPFATPSASSSSTSRPQSTSSTVQEQDSFQLAVQSSTIPSFSPRSDVETPPPAVAVSSSPLLDSPYSPRTPFVTPSASSSSTSRPHSTSSTVQEQDSFQLAAQSPTIPSFSPRSDVETPPPAVAVPFSPSPDSPCFPCTPFATPSASSSSTSRPQPASSAVQEHAPFQLAAQSPTIPSFFPRSEVETLPPAVAVPFSPSPDSPYFPRTPFATPSASSSSTSRRQSTSSTVQEHAPFQLAAQSPTIPSFSPRSEVEPPPPAVAVPSSPSTDLPRFPRTTFAFQLAQASPSPVPSSVRSSPPLEEAIHYQTSLLLSPPPGYTPRCTPPKHGRDSEGFMEHQFIHGPHALPNMTSANASAKRRRISPSPTPSPTPSPSSSGSETESDEPMQKTEGNAGDVNYGGRASPPRFGRRSGTMKLDLE